MYISRHTLIKTEIGSLHSAQQAQSKEDNTHVEKS